jgi:methyl-accepting chemotaxis protein
VKVRTKLLALALTPLAVALGLSAMELIVQSKSYVQVTLAARNLAFMQASTVFVENLQKERRAASLALSGKLEPGRFGEAIKATDDSRAAWGASFKAVNLPALIQRAADRALAAVQTARDGVKRGGSDPNAMANAYSAATDSLLDGSRLAAAHATPGTATRFLSLVLLEESKEWADRTRVMVTGVAEADRPIGDVRAADLLVRFGSIRALLYSRALEVSDESQADRDIAFKDTEYSDLSTAVIGILRKSGLGGYELSSEELSKNSSSVIDKIQAIIAREEAEIRKLVEAEVKSIGGSLLLTFSLAASVLIATVIAAFLILASITRRLGLIISAFHDVAAGEGNLASTIDLSSGDEIGGLAGDFNAFSGAIRGLVVKVKDETGKISGNMDELAANMSETAGAVQEMAATIDAIKQQGLNQAASVTESYATVEEIAKRVEILTTAIGRQAEHISVSGSSIEQMVANIQSVTANVESMGDHYQRLKANSDRGLETIQTLVSQARGIVLQSESLQEANSVISGIASLTNLLAMNAEIEAAHAGEAGRGFSVVADEIRKLAENAGEQSKSVAVNLESIRQGITEVVSSSDLAEKSFEEIVGQISVLSDLEGEVKNAMREQSAGSSNVLESLAQMRKVTAEVREEALAMRSGDEAVLEEMRRLERLTSELERGMDEMATGAEQIRAAASATNELSFRAVDSVRSLAEETGKFRT